MKFLIFLLAAVSGGPGFARSLTKAESGSVVEHYLMDVHVNQDGSSVQTISYAVRVQAEDAKTSASLFTIEYNSQIEKVEVLEAFTLNDKTKIPVEPAAIEDRDKGESKAYDAVKIRSVAFPQVQIGSRLFVKYRTITAKSPMPDRWSDSVVLHAGIIIEKFELTVDSARPLAYRLRDPLGLLRVKQSDPRHLRARLKRETSGWVVGEREPYFHPAGFTELWISTHRDWREFMANLDGDFEKIQAAGVPVKLQPWVREARRLKTEDERILFLMEKMSQNFRYFGDWRRYNGGLVPRSLDEIERSRYGDCKDLASLLVSLLRALDFTANVALVRRGENAWGVEPDYDLPATGRFNHAITQVRLGARVRWLDATNPVAALEPFSDISGRPAFVLDPKGGYFDRLLPAKPSDYHYHREYEYKFADAQTDVHAEARFFGLGGFHLSTDLMLAPRSDVLSGALDWVTEGQDVLSYHYDREPQTGRVLKDIAFDLKYRAGRVMFNAGTAGFFVIPDNLSGAFFETATRESDLKLADDVYDFTSTRRLKGRKLAQPVPARCQVNSDWLDLERAIAVDGADVVINQRVTMKQPYITRAEFQSAGFKRLQAETRRCFFHSGILVAPR